MYGEMIGDTTRADRLVAIMDGVIKRLDVLQSVAEADRPNVLLLSPIGDRLYVAGGGAGGLFSDSIYAAGGINAAAALPGLIATSVEQIAAWNPDVILLFQAEDTSSTLIYDHPIFSEGKASKARRVYVVPIGVNNWGSMGPDEFLFQIWLAELLFPDRLAATLRQDMHRTYTGIFGRSLSESELDTVLRPDLNRTSVGYARFLRNG